MSRGRIFFVSSDAVYAFGPKTAKTLTGFAVDEPPDALGTTLVLPPWLEAQRGRIEAAVPPLQSIP